MANLTASQQAMASRITAFTSHHMIRGQHNVFRSLARDMGQMSRPDIVRIGVESIREPGTDVEIDPSARLARLICESETLSKLKPGSTAWAWDQIGRDPAVRPTDFGKAVAVFQERKADQLLLNIDRTHRSWISMLKSDNLMDELMALHRNVPQEVHGATGNWMVWAARARDGVQEPLTHQVHSFSKYLMQQLNRAQTCISLFGNNYSTIPSIVAQIRTLGNAVEKETNKILLSEAPDEERAYARNVKASVSHAMDIAEAYMKYLPTEILVYSAEAPENMGEAVDRLLEEQAPDISFADILKRAEKRVRCPGGDAAAAKWYAFFDELMLRDGTEGLMGSFPNNPLIASYTALRQE